MKKYLIPAIAILLSACGSPIEGTYTHSLGGITYTFKSGKVLMSAMGVSQEMDYEVEDGNVKLKLPQGTMVMKILEDGSLSAPMGKLIKQK